MKTSEKTGELVKALLKSQQEFPTITKDKTAKVPTKSGGQYSYTYADLTTVLDAVRPVLLKNGLVLQHGAEANGHNAINCRLSHISGEWQESALNLPDGVEAQSMGSAVTYYRRYTACAMLGISTEDDDDGAAAKPAPKQAKVYTVKAAPAAAPAQDEDRVPASVTDASPEPTIVPDDGYEQIIINSVAKKEGAKDGKPWTRFGIKAAFSDGSEEWVNTFSASFGELAEKFKGGTLRAKLTEKQFNGKTQYDLVDLKE